MENRQLTLNVRIPDRYSLQNFVAGDNSELVSRLADLAQARVPSDCILVWGPAGSGKSHLLRAVCHAAPGSSEYRSLSKPDLAPDELTALTRVSLVCIDDIDAVIGDPQWETALLALYERARGRTSLVLAARAAPQALPFCLPDLQSRLRAGLVYGVRPLSDEQKLQALQARARDRGFELPEDAGLYVLNRYPRDMHALFALLDRLDDATLEAQRRITVPFLRSLEERT
jgi:DnaA family protein